MTKEDYIKKVEELNDNHRTKLNNLGWNYAYDSSPYKIGDTVTDHIGSITIDRIDWQKQYSTGIPQCVYTGLQITKKSVPFKSGETRRIYQENITVSNE